MKNIFKKSMPLLAALAVTTTALPLSLAATTSTIVSAEEGDRFPNQYFVEHWVEIRDSKEISELKKREVPIREHENRLFILRRVDTKNGTFGQPTNEQPVKEMGNGEKLDFTKYTSREVHNLERVGESIFKKEVYIYYYLA